MDARHFDSLTRSLITSGSRRRAIALALAGALASLLGREEADAHDKLKKCKRINDNDKRKKCLKKAKRHKKRHGKVCQDGVKNGSETDIDCGGGTCPRCAIGKTCAGRDDCASARCVSGACQACVNNLTDCGTDVDGTTCACRDHESGQRFCTKSDGRFLPPGSSCTACQGDEQCFPIGGGAGGIECIRPCGVA